MHKVLNVAQKMLISLIIISYVKSEFNECLSLQSILEQLNAAILYIFHILYYINFILGTLYSLGYFMLLLSRSVMSDSCDPIECSSLGSSVHGIFQARILELVAISCSKGSSQPRDQTHISHVSCTGRLILYHLNKHSNYHIGEKTHLNFIHY